MRKLSICFATLFAFLLPETVVMANELPVALETKVIRLATNWEKEMQRLTEYDGLYDFCSDASHRQGIYGLLDEIHDYHTLLYRELKQTKHHHSERSIKRILKHIEKMEEDYNIQSFNTFFGERCISQKDLEKRADQYKSGFGVHSYYGKIQVMEVEMHRYLKRLTKRITSVKKHVNHFYVRKQVWEY